MPVTKRNLKLGMGQRGFNVGGGIERKQSGVLNMSGSPSYVNLASNTNYDNAFLQFSYYNTTFHTEIYNSLVNGRLEPESSRIAFFSPYPISKVVYWEVIEFSGVKSNQMGQVSTEASTTNVTINPVDMSKCLVFVSISILSSVPTAAALMTYAYRLTTSTNLEIRRTSGSGSANWQVIEFE